MYPTIPVYRVSVGDKLTIAGEVATVIESTPMCDGYHLITYVSAIHPESVTLAYIRNALVAPAY